MVILTATLMCVSLCQADIRNPLRYLLDSVKMSPCGLLRFPRQRWNE